MGKYEQMEDTLSLHKTESRSSIQSFEMMNPEFDEEPKKSFISSKTRQQTAYYIKNSCKDIWRHKCHFCISTLSIFIVVLMALVIYTVVDEAPIIFLRLAEK